MFMMFVTMIFGLVSVKVAHLLPKTLLSMLNRGTMYAHNTLKPSDIVHCSTI